MEILPIFRSEMENRLNKFLDEQIDAIKILYDKPYLTPLLTIFYTTIDILGYITGKGFDGFIRKYMIFEDVNSSDLWAGRCSIIHTNTPKSEHSKKGKARQILYSWGKADINDLKKIILNSSEPHKYVAVEIESLRNSLILGISQFKKDIEINSKLRSMCATKVKEFYVNTGKIVKNSN